MGCLKSRLQERFFISNKTAHFFMKRNECAGMKITFPKQRPVDRTRIIM